MGDYYFNSVYCQAATFDETVTRWYQEQIKSKQGDEKGTENRERGKRSKKISDEWTDSCMITNTLTHLFTVSLRIRLHRIASHRSAVHDISE